MKKLSRRFSKFNCAHSLPCYADQISGNGFLEGQCDIHFYVSCALQKDQLRVVTYLCPQTLSREKQANKRQLMMDANEEDQPMKKSSRLER